MSNHMSQLSEKVHHQEKLIITLFERLDDQEAVIEQMTKFIMDKGQIDEFRQFVNHLQIQSRRKGIHLIK